MSLIRAYLLCPWLETSSCVPAKGSPPVFLLFADLLWARQDFGSRTGSLPLADEDGTGSTVSLVTADLQRDWKAVGCGRDGAS